MDTLTNINNYLNGLINGLAKSSPDQIVDLTTALDGANIGPVYAAAISQVNDNPQPGVDLTLQAINSETVSDPTSIASNVANDASKAVSSLWTEIVSGIQGILPSLTEVEVAAVVVIIILVLLLLLAGKVESL